ncbi:nitrite transporter NirC [Geomicrobium halophilum]|uniref:Nitrite transporter NirC n=1 Tax=Geomicrobium halophilum TaxID=549000 RepID=A0A841PZ57_9BACL|nr:formate/nitrite transporter family protein [Geomicrobium halophilum]MBB6450133.1 nitrite transporter NirC [Geomicrobium halophilum]
MYHDTLKTLNNQAQTKKGLLQSSLPRYLVSSILAGGYLGIGTIVLFAVGAPLSAVDSPMLGAVTGVVFGIALALVLFAGSDLFTGNHLIFTVSSLSKVTEWRDTLGIWGWSFLGNLIGALAFSLLVLFSGLFAEVGPDHFMMTLAEEKINPGVIELFFRAILCNWLVCLAIWASLRTENDMAKLFLIFVLIFAFVASSMEHSVANMAILSMALVHGGSETVTIAGFFHNLIPVTIGNIIGGSVLVGGSYYYISKNKRGKLGEGA